MGVVVGFDVGQDLGVGIGGALKVPFWSISVLRVPMKDSGQAL